MTERALINVIEKLNPKLVKSLNKLGIKNIKQIQKFNLHKLPISVGLNKKLLIQLKSVVNLASIDGIADDTLYGMVECDVFVPNDKYDKFKEFSPIFCTTEVDFNNIGMFI